MSHLKTYTYTLFYSFVKHTHLSHLLFITHFNQWLYHPRPDLRVPLKKHCLNIWLKSHITFVYSYVLFVTHRLQHILLSPNYIVFTKNCILAHFTIHKLLFFTRLHTLGHHTSQINQSYAHFGLCDIFPHVVTTLFTLSMRTN